MRDPKTRALMRVPDEPSDQELVQAIRRSCQLLDRFRSCIVTTCRSDRQPDGTDKRVLDFVDKKQKPDRGGSYLVIDGTTDEIFSIVRYSDKPPTFPLPPGKQLVVGRRYLLFRMGKA